MNDSGLLDAGSALLTVLTSTYLGHAGLCGVVVLLGLAAARFSGKRLQAGPLALLVPAILVLVFAFARASISHAAEAGAFGFPVWVEWVHLLSISAWVGVVAVSGWVLLPSIASDRQPGTDTAQLLATMSRTATAALAGVLATGAYNTYRGIGSVGNLLGNPYANVLLIKLTLVAVAVGMGGFNRFIGIPSCIPTRPENEVSYARLSRVITVLRIESFVLLGVLVAAALLTSQPPPASI